MEVSMFDFPHFVASTQRRSKMTSFRVPTSHVHGKSSADLKYPEEGFKCESSDLVMSACCCSCSWTLRHTSSAAVYTFPILVKRAAILSLRRKPAALRFSMWPRQASIAPESGREERMDGTEVGKRSTY